MPSLGNLVLVAVTEEDPTLRRYDVGNGSRLFSALVAVSGYSALTLVQNVWRSEVVPNILSRPQPFATSSGYVKYTAKLKAKKEEETVG